ncbi:hypothetical protein J6590_084883 [Homalodisca vitripennis]|nr:hypothetical protein J6590_084883 [Homalodisca vitripennis]
MKKTVKKSKKTLQKIANPKGKSKFRKTNSKIRPDIKQEKKRCWKNLSFDTPSDDDDGDGFTCNDDEMDDLAPMVMDVSASTRNVTDSEGVCCLCGEFGKNNELWYRCIICSGWVHSECSGAETATDFICDFCYNKK